LREVDRVVICRSCYEMIGWWEVVGKYMFCFELVFIDGCSAWRGCRITALEYIDYLLLFMGSVLLYIVITIVVIMKNYMYFSPFL